MRNRLTTAIASALTVVCGCGDASGDPWNDLESVPSDAFIRLADRTRVPAADDPHYEVFVDASGAVTFEGHLYAGEQETRQVSPDEVLALLQQAGSFGFSSISQAELDGPCLNPGTDASEYTIEIRAGGHSNELYDYYTCPDDELREPLRQLRADVEAVLASRSWLEVR